MTQIERQHPRYRFTTTLTAQLSDNNGHQTRVEIIDISRSGVRVRALEPPVAAEGLEVWVGATPRVSLRVESGRLDGLDIPFAVVNQPAPGQVGLKLLSDADLAEAGDPSLAACALRGERMLCLLEEIAQQRGMPEAPEEAWEKGRDQGPEEPKSLGEQIKELLRPEVFLENLVSLVLESLLVALPADQLNALTNDAVDEAREFVSAHYRQRQAFVMRALSHEMVHQARRTPGRTGIQIFRDAVAKALKNDELVGDAERAAFLAKLWSGLDAASPRPGAAATAAAGDPEFAKWFRYHLDDGERVFTIGAGYSAAEFFIEAFQDRTQYADEIAYLTDDKTLRRQQFCREVGLLFAARAPEVARAGVIFREEAWRMYQASHAQVKPVEEMLSFYPRQELRDTAQTPREQAQRDIKFRFLNRLSGLIAGYAQRYVAAHRHGLDAEAEAEAAQQELRAQVEEAPPNQFLTEQLPRFIAATGVLLPAHHAAAKAFAQAHPDLPMLAVEGQPVLVLGGPGLKELERLVTRNWGQRHPLGDLGTLIHLRKAAADPRLREALTPIVTGRLLRLTTDRERYLEMIYLVRLTPAQVAKVYEVAGRNAETLLERIRGAALNLNPPRKTRPAAPAAPSEPA